jgi:hypothetical protein
MDERVGSGQQSRGVWTTRMNILASFGPRRIGRSLLCQRFLMGSLRVDGHRANLMVDRSDVSQGPASVLDTVLASPDGAWLSVVPRESILAALDLAHGAAVSRLPPKCQRHHATWNQCAACPMREDK